MEPASAGERWIAGVVGSACLSSSEVLRLRDRAARAPPALLPSRVCFMALRLHVFTESLWEGGFGFQLKQSRALARKR